MGRHHVEPNNWSQNVFLPARSWDMKYQSDLFSYQALASLNLVIHNWVKNLEDYLEPQRKSALDFLQNVELK